MSAIYRNLQSKCIEIIQFAFMCTICTRVQINLHHLEDRSKFAPGCKSFKHRSHGKIRPRVQICTRVLIAHMNEALGFSIKERENCGVLTSKLLQPVTWQVVGADIHLFKVISERFQSHFSEYALMILK